MSNSKSSQGVERGDVKLDREHNHGGIIYPPGSILENMRPDQIARLEDQGIGKRTNEKPSEAKKHDGK
jgi:hypothetical protein